TLRSITVQEGLFITTVVATG
nr:immunoglobulin heavy chain junction region [Mus musculus]